MDIKDFHKGQIVYVLNLHTGRNTEPTIREDVVISVGRKYVTTERGKYERSEDPYGLYEHIDWGERTYLCPSMEYCQMHIEREKLRLWLYRAAQFDKEYSLVQLRKVKEILD